MSSDSPLAFDYKYLSFVRQLLDKEKVTRLQVGSHVVNRIHNFSFDVDIPSDGVSFQLPYITSRRINLEHSIREVMWMLSGSKNVNDLGKTKSFWEPWADNEGNLDVSYGSLMLQDGQLEEVLSSAKASNSRRCVVSLWNKECGTAKQPPCHPVLHFIPENKVLHLQVMARSQDVINGLPYDLLNYALILIAAAVSLDMRVGKLFWVCSVIELYEAHHSTSLEYVNHTYTHARMKDFGKAIVTPQRHLMSPHGLISDQMREVIGLADFKVTKPTFDQFAGKFPLQVN